VVKNDNGQLYTIEGFAAGLIMVITAYLVVNATSVYTAGDTHINDMQLEALGSDALRMMDIPINATESDNRHSDLRMIIENSEYDIFKTKFLDYTNESGSGPGHDIQFNASYSCRDSSDNIQSVQMVNSRNLTGGEHAVRSTKWVIVDKECPGAGPSLRERAVLVEVLLWRD